VVEEQTESWQLRSGTWSRELKSEHWRLATTAIGTVVDAKLSTQDIGRMIGAKRDTASGQWFPSDFNYSPQTGAQLQTTITGLDATWVPPFGASALSDMARPLARGLRQTPAPLALARPPGGFDPARAADRTLPALPSGRYRFLVHRFDAASPILMAIEPAHGDLLILLPESNLWIPLERPHGVLTDSPGNPRGWRMEVVEGARFATLYLPTASGLAAVTPTLFGLSCRVEHFGKGPALGSPVAWAGRICMPALDTKGCVALVGKAPGAAKPIVLHTSFPPPKNGFEAPVFDPLQVIWPSEEGQLIVRADQDGKEEADWTAWQTDWIAWPDGLKPAFPLGCPYLSPSGSFWQLCRKGESESFEYVQLGQRGPATAATDAPRMGTGHVSYRKALRIEGDPWTATEHVVNKSSSEIVVPLIESERSGAVVGLRIDAPQGVLALLESDEKTHHAVLQLQTENHVEVRFGTLSITRPWLTSVFVHDAHLWVYHPELPQALGWKLEG